MVIHLVIGIVQRKVLYGIHLGFLSFSEVLLHPDKADASPEGIIHGLFFDKVFLCLVLCSSYAVFELNILILRVILRSSYRRGTVKPYRHLYIPLLREELTCIDIHHSIKLFYFLTAALIRLLLYSTKAYSTDFPRNRHIHKVGCIEIHSGNTSPTAFVLQLGHT